MRPKKRQLMQAKATGVVVRPCANAISWCGGSGSIYEVTLIL